MTNSSIEPMSCNWKCGGRGEQKAWLCSQSSEVESYRDGKSSSGEGWGEVGYGQVERGFRGRVWHRAGETLGQQLLCWSELYVHREMGRRRLSGGFPCIMMGFLKGMRCRFELLVSCSWMPTDASLGAEPGQNGLGSCGWHISALSTLHGLPLLLLWPHAMEKGCQSQAFQTLLPPFCDGMLLPVSNLAGAWQDRQHSGLCHSATSPACQETTSIRRWS